MSSAFRAFMSGLIDYAGLFPPADLDMGSAAAEYARHRREPESWILGRFLLPVARLDRLERHLDEASPPGVSPLRISAVFSAGTGDNPATRIAAETAMLRSFASRHAGRVAVEAVEGRNPSAFAVRTFAETLRAALEAEGFPPIPLFVEADPSEASDAEAIEEIASVREAGIAAGFKLRCGGARAQDFPSAERVEAAIEACVSRRVPMKCTAGLHQPVRRFVDPPGAVAHGFLNVFGAGILASVGSLHGAEILDCLLDEDTASFRFEGNRFYWKDRGTVAEEIEAARRSLMTGYGSCSFEEPRQDLKALRMLA